MRTAGVNVFLISVLFFMGIRAWRCETLRCIISPLALKLWYHHIEVQAEAIRVSAGTDVSITCDGACVGAFNDPLLRWYGPNRHWIGNEQGGSRIHIERSISGQHQKLHIKDVTEGDRGYYYCRGWLGKKKGFDLKRVLLMIESQEPESLPVELTTMPEYERPIPTTRDFPPSATVEKSQEAAPAREPTTQSHATTESHHSGTSNTTVTGTCHPPKFQCGSGECYDASFVCDSFPDCSDGSDEFGCETTACAEGQTACLDGSGCVLSHQVCDGTPQCSDGSDERSVVCQHS